MTTCIKTGKPLTVKRAIEQVEQRLSKDGWPEYYDGKAGRYIGKQARKVQEDSQAKAHPLHFLLSQTSGSSIHDDALESLYFYSLAADYGFEPNALDPFKILGSLDSGLELELLVVTKFGIASWPLKQIMAKISAE
ncbi:Plant neutral invertase family protein, partial [Prunus dulcis]